jgi:hypothetical protein
MMSTNFCLRIRIGSDAIRRPYIRYFLKELNFMGGGCGPAFYRIDYVGIVA